MPEITVTLNLSQEEALKFVKGLAYDKGFYEQVSRDPVGVLGAHGITLSHSAEDLGIRPMLPPQHVFQEALVNIEEASEFSSESGFTSPDPFPCWIFVVFLAT